MKSKLLLIAIAVILLTFPKVNFGQAPNLGTAANFVLFTTVGAVGNTGISQVTGNVGTNSGAITGFGNVNGVMTTSNGASAQAAADLTIAYNQLNSTVPNFFPAPLLGNGQILTPGVYSISGPTTLNLALILDAQGDPDAVFIFQIQGAFSSAASSKVILINGAQACNVFWKIEGLVNLAAGTTMRGTIIANNGAINMNTGDTLEGRALSTTGAINVSGVLAYTPVGCGSPYLTGPPLPNLASAACYALFTSDGPVDNAGISYVTGDIGTNNGTVSGFNPLFVVGAIHTIPDGSTAQAATDLLNTYNTTNIIPHDIELLYPAQFGHGLVLTPHTYLMNAAAALTDSLYLNAMGNADGVFVIKINGALTTSVYSRVVLINGAQAKNVFWVVEGAVSINEYSIFKGTIISHNGAISLMTGVSLEGRALTTNGAFNTAAITAVMPPGCGPAAPPAITNQPENQTACAGDSVSFTVSASGDGLTYQWRKGLVNLVDGGNISGATTATLTINPANQSDAALNYNVVVTGTTAPAVTSNNVALIIDSAPTIFTQPSDQTAAVGGSVSFTVMALGTNLTYQWRKGLVNLINAGNISGANSATLTINPVGLIDEASNYNVIISGSCSPDTTSVDVALVISNSPNIVTQPISQTVCVGSSVSFTVTATGDGLTYQWRKGLVNLINGGSISGANTATLTINPTVLTDAALNYNVVVSGTSLPAVTSNNVSLSFNTAPSITSQPANQTAALGSSASFTVMASGTNLTYQWRKGLVNLVNAGNISGANTATLTINPVGLLDEANNYNVVITGDCNPAVTSINVSLVISNSPNIVTQPINQTVCVGSPVSFTVTATGDGLTYQWRKGLVNLINGGSISGANTATLTINPTVLTDAALNYNVVVSGTYLPAVTSNNVSLNFNMAPSITSQPANQTASLGSSASFTVIASGNNLTYQWRKGLVNLINAGNISGANTATLTINPVGLLDEANNYNVVITGDCNPAVTSINVSLMISNSPNIVTQPINQTVCVGSPVSFTVIATGDGLTYQWRKGLVNLINGGSISGVNTATLTINPTVLTDAALNYNVVVSGTYLPAVTSNNVSLNFNMAPSITSQPANQTATLGSSASFTVIATGNNLTYQWRKGLVNLVNTGNISGANTATLTINPVGLSDEAANYNVIITGLCNPAATSVNVALVISNSPQIITQPIDQTVCVGSSVSFTVTATGDGLTYQWRKGLVNLTNGGSISGVTTATLTINPAMLTDAALNYNVVVSGTYLPAVTSNNVSLSFNTAPTITLQPANQTAALGSSASFTVIASGNNLTYQWRKGLVNLVNGGNISGANTATLTINPVGLSDEAANYNVIISGLCNPAATSVNVSLVISNSPNIVTQPTSVAACVGSAAVFTVVASGDGLTYQWRQGLVNLVNGGNISGVNTATLTINPVSLADAALNYNVVVSGTFNPSVTSVNVSLIVDTPPVILTQPANQTAVLGSSASFSVIASGTNLTYQWRKGLVNLVNAGNISGANTATLTINPVGLTDEAANYNVVITGTCGPQATSINVALVISNSPSILTQPTSVTACAGSSAVFTVVASGDGLTYQWRKGLVNLVNGGNISGVNTATLTINPVSLADAALNYNVVVSGTFMPAVTSVNVSLSVNTAPNIITEPTNQAECAGDQAIFSVIAEGSGISYQWRLGTTNLTNGSHITGANTSVLTINNVTASDAATNYNVVISGICNPAETSNNVTLTVNPIPVAVATSNSPVFAGNSILLSTPTINGGTYHWTGPNGFTSSVQNPEITSAEMSDAGIYTLSVAAFGCQSAPADITVEVIQFSIPEGFSPNADGINDDFVIRGIENYPDNSITIFNRWGNKVFEANPYENNWDGTNSFGITIGGTELPVGTYFYILDLGNSSDVIKGNIFLNR